MIVQCAKCSTKFKIADDKVTATGVKVRCSKCKNVFVVKKEAAPAGGEAVPVKAPLPPSSLPPPPAVSSDNIFSQPTRVAPPPAGGDFPIPAPVVPAGSGQNLADLIDLDSDDQQPVPGVAAPAAVPPPPSAVVPPPPVAASSPPAAASSPPAAAPASELGEDLFKDLGDIDIPPPPGQQSVAPSTAPDAAAPLATPGPLPPPPAPTPAGPPPTAATSAPAAATAPASEPPATPLPAAIPGVVQAAADDDPFADIDLGMTPPGAPAAAPPAVPPPPPAASGAGDDLFGSLGDPFAGVGDAAPAPAPPPAAPTTAAPEEPFASLDSPSPPPAAPAVDDPFATGEDSPAGGGAAMEEVLSRNDPFAGQGDGTDVDASPSGLQLDEEGHLVGEAPPPPPPPTKTISPAPAESTPAATEAPPVAPAPAPMAQEPMDRRAGGGNLVYKIGFGLLALVVALLAFVAFRSGGKPDLTSWSTYARAFGLTGLSRQHAGPLRITRQSNTTYRNSDGQRLLLVWGQVKNTSPSSAAGITVTVRLVDEQGKQLVAKTVPAGVVFRPEQVFAMTTPEQVDAAYRRAIEKKRPALDGNQQLPFMCIMFDYPTGLDRYFFQVEAAASADPWLGLGPPVETTTGKEPAPLAAKPTPPPGKKTPPPAPGRGRLRKAGGDFIRLKKPAPATADHP